jgi:hypothetical protein
LACGAVQPAGSLIINSSTNHYDPSMRVQLLLLLLLLLPLLPPLLLLLLLLLLLSSSAAFKRSKFAAVPDPICDKSF